MMAVLTRKGGGLPANYREDYFWLNRMEAPEREPVRGQVEAQAAQAAQAEPVKTATADVAAEATPEMVLDVAAEVAPDVVEASPEVAEAE